MTSADLDSDLTTLRDIGAAVSAHWLRAVGIATVAELHRVGSAEAYGRVAYPAADHGKHARARQR